MKKYLLIPLLTLLSLMIASCKTSRLTQLEATNAALNDQLSTLMSQMTQQANSAIQTAQKPSLVDTQSIAPTELPLALPSPLPIEKSTDISPVLILSGSGLITPWSNRTYYPSHVFGTANVHLACDPNHSSAGEIWIDTENYKIGCDPKGDGWSIWKPEITVGDHYIYSANDADKYEFWTVGTPPFFIRNNYASTDYMFQINTHGIYNLSAYLVNGTFDVYITCEGAQNFDYHITQSTTIPLVLNPASCKLIVRDSPPGTVTPGDIEVSLEFSGQ